MRTGKVKEQRVAPAQVPHQPLKAALDVLPCGPEEGVFLVFCQHGDGICNHGSNANVGPGHERGGARQKRRPCMQLASSHLLGT